MPTPIELGSLGESGGETDFVLRERAAVDRWDGWSCKSWERLMAVNLLAGPELRDIGLARVPKSLYYERPPSNTRNLRRPSPAIALGVLLAMGGAWGARSAGRGIPSVGIMRKSVM